MESTATRPSRYNKHPQLLSLDILLPAITTAGWLKLDTEPLCLLKCREHGTGYIVSRHTTILELIRVLQHGCCLADDVGRPPKGYHRPGYANPARIPPGRPVDIR